AFQQHHWLLDAGDAQRQRLGQARDAEGIGIGQATRAFHQSMTVGIGLHHGHDAAARRHRPDAGEVVPQRRGADLGTDVRDHLRTPSAYASGMKFEKRVYLPWKVSTKWPVSPLRCLASSTSASPLRGEFLS